MRCSFKQSDYYWILLLFACIPSLCAQNEHLKHDYIWQFGYHYGPKQVKYEGAILDFHYNPPRLRTEPRWIEFHFANAGLCDAEGELSVYTNGCRMFNGKHEPMLNGDTLPDLWIYFGYCSYYQFHVMRHSNLLLPQPGHDSIVYHLNFGMTIDTASPHYLVTDTFYQSIINLKAAGGRGAIVQKNKVALASLFLGSSLTACRHANGRDWWVVVNRWLSNQYYFFLLDPSGFRLHHTQKFGSPSGISGRGTGQAVFSPKGDWYIVSENEVGVRVYRFDRCAGLFYGKPLVLPILEEPRDDGWNTPGVAVSANNRYLYTAFYLNCYQFDLEAPDILASKEHVAQWDGTKNVNGWATYFYYLLLGPDNKIYSSIPGPNTYLHRINHPDLKGKACDFEQHALELPNWNYSVLPNLPYFRSGVVTGSTCDTLGLVSAVPDSPPEVLEVQLAPNPAAQQVFLQLGSGAAVIPRRVRFYNATGQLHQAYSLEAGQTDIQIDVSAWPPGMYFWDVSGSDGKSGKGKMVKMYKLIVQP